MINEAIGGNMVVAVRPAPGCTLCVGERAFIRLDRDVFRQAGVTTVLWLEGINDLGVADFDLATRDQAHPGLLLPAFNLQSKTGGMGDFLHPGRPGFISMANAFDLSQFR